MAATIPFSFAPLVFSRHFACKVKSSLLICFFDLCSFSPRRLSPFFLGVTCEDFQPEIRFATLNISQNHSKEALTWCRKDWMKETVVIEPRDCKSLLTGRTCTREDFLSPITCLKSRNRMVLWSVTAAAAVVKPCDYLHTDKTSFHLPSVLNSVLKNFCRNFAKFGPEKFDFDLYKGFFKNGKKNWAKIRQLSRKKFKIQIANFFMIKFQ
jgi:hypothetical protein